MRDVQLIELAAGQFNRFSRAQALDLGVTDKMLGHRVASGRLISVEQAVFAFAPLLDDERGRWMGATLTAPGTVLSHASAAAASGFWDRARRFETVTRPGDGGPRLHGGTLVFRSRVLDGMTTVTPDGIPVTCPERTLLDLAPHLSDKHLARALREAIRLEATTMPQLVDLIVAYRRRRGATRLLRIASRYADLPLERARSGAEVRALTVLREAGCLMPELNRRIAGEEADLSWREFRRIVEIDGKPFHLDLGEDERKETAWRHAGWDVLRIPSDDVYEHPERLIALAPR